VKTMRSSVAMVLIGMLVSSVSASSIEFSSLFIDLTDIGDARAKATWSEEILSITETGLGWNGEPASSQEGWMQTLPLALGLSWRPPYSVSVRVSVDHEFLPDKGQGATPCPGMVYARYSPDMEHWSAWQALAVEGSERGRFQGELRVPDSERERYSRLLSEYSRLDVPWKSDEHAAVLWIIGREPDFFSRQLPFIGYVQFTYDADFHAGLRIKSFAAEIVYTIGGIHTPPEDPDTYLNRNSEPWSFR